jgi:hypothetical protein
MRQFLFAALLSAPAIGFAQTAHAKTVASSPAQEFPTPGSCNYLQLGVKVCSALSDGHGSFDVSTAVPAAIYVRTEDPISHFVPPDPHYFQSQKVPPNAVIIAPIQDHLPEVTPAIITTKTLTITLKIHHGSQRQADTQLSIHDPLRGQRTVAIEEAVAEAEKRVEARLTTQLHDALLEDLARDGAESRKPKGQTIGRNNALIVLEATQLLRLGPRRLLFFLIENRSGEPFQVKALHLLIAEREIPAPSWKIARPTIQPAEQVRGVVELPLETRPEPFRLRVEETDSQRTVELSGIQVR